MGSLIGVIIVVTVLFGGVLGCVRLGHRLSVRAKSDDGKGEAAFGVVGGALLGLLGLILGFSFAGAQSRMDSRRQLIVQEANAIGTAYLRLDLLRAEDQPALRELFRTYTDLRVEEHRARTNSDELAALHQKTSELQQQIWKMLVAAAEARQEPASKALVLPPANEMIDLTATQSVARRTHMPVVSLLLLIVLSLLSGLVIGRAMSGMPRRSLLISVVYALSIAATVYVILDLELPRVGLIRLDFVEDAMREAREGMR